MKEKEDFAFRTEDFVDFIHYCEKPFDSRNT